MHHEGTACITSIHLNVTFADRFNCVTFILQEGVSFCKSGERSPCHCLSTATLSLPLAGALLDYAWWQDRDCLLRIRQLRGGDDVLRNCHRLSDAEHLTKRWQQIRSWLSPQTQEAMGGAFQSKHISVAAFEDCHDVVLIVSVAHKGCRIPSLGICVSSRREKEKVCGWGVASSVGRVLASDAQGPQHNTSREW